MIRQRENSVLWQAGALSLLVHVVCITLLVMTFSFKHAPTMQVAEVELWDSLPVAQVRPPPPPEPPKPEPVIEPKPEPAPEPKAEIQLKPKPEKKPKPKEVPPKPDPRDQAKKEEQRKLAELQRAMLAEDDPAQAQEREVHQVAAARNAQAQALASSGALDGDIAKVAAKIRRFVNSQVCGSGKPVVEFSVALMPTGEVIGQPQLTKGSGIPACDDAVVRAILQAQPLPVPKEPERFAHFRDLKLKFRPNDN